MTPKLLRSFKPIADIISFTDISFAAIIFIKFMMFWLSVCNLSSTCGVLVGYLWGTCGVKVWLYAPLAFIQKEGLARRPEGENTQKGLFEYLPNLV
jgi:hypothetical protein